MRRIFGPALAGVAVAHAAVAGCASTPDLRFADADSATDASTPLPDSGGGGGDAAPDTGAVDTGAVDSGAAVDAASTACPSSPPPSGANACCDTYPCVDRTSNNSCATCAACLALRCQTGEVCCYSKQGNGNLSCRTSLANCKARAPSASRGAPTDQDFWREMMRGGFSSFEHVARARPRARRRDDGRTLSLSSPLGPLAYALVIERYVRRLRQARASYLKSMLERGVRVRGLLGSRRAGARVRAA
jgi:hypothetical protein